MHQQNMLPDYCTKSEYNQPILLWDITTYTKNVWKSSHNYSNLAQSQMLFYKQCITPDNCTKYEQNYQIVLWDITTNTQNCWKNGHNYSNLAQSQILTCISNAWYLIVVPNMKKIHPAITEECARTDIWTDRPDPFLYSPIPLRRSG